MDSTGFVPVLISGMHNGPGLSKPRLTSNGSLQLIGKINDSSRIAIIISRCANPCFLESGLHQYLGNIKHNRRPWSPKRQNSSRPVVSLSLHNFSRDSSS